VPKKHEFGLGWVDRRLDIHLAMLDKRAPRLWAIDVKVVDLV
jgi:hypothetical protein